MTFGSWLKSHGVSITQMTSSWTGGAFTRTTKTPTNPFQNQVRPDGVTRKKLDEKRKTEGLKESEAAHVKFSGENLKKHAAGLLKRDLWGNVFENEKAHLFPTSDPAQLRRFHYQMDRIEGRLPENLLLTPRVTDRPREARIMPGASMTVLLNAASTACNRAALNADDAANAIACLQHIDMIAAIAAPLDGAGAVPNPNGNQPRRPGGGNFNQADLANAWRIAIELEQSGEAGFDLLKHLMRTPAAPNYTLHPTVARQRDALLHTYLQAAREKVKEAANREIVNAAEVNNGLLMPDPRSIHTHINRKLNADGNANNQPGNNPGDGVHNAGAIGGRVFRNPVGNPARDPSLLDKAVKAVANHMQQVQAHAGNRDNAKRQISFDRHHLDIRPGTNPQAYRVLNKDCYWWAANLVRSGVYSEDSKQYRRLQYRAQKMATWLHRANDNNANRALSRGERAQRWLKQAFMPMKDKSPFHAYNNVVPDSPHRLLAGTDQSGIADGQTVRQNLIWELEKAIEQHGTPPVDGGQGTVLRSGRYAADHAVAAKQNQPAVPDNPADPAILTQMVRLAILKMQYRFNAKANGVTMFISRHTEGDNLEGLDIERAKAEVYEMFVGGKAAQNPGTQRLIDLMFAKEHENKQISPETLIGWANDVEGPGEIAGALAAWGNDIANRNNAVITAIRNFRNNLPAAPQWNQPDWEKFVAGVNRTLLGRAEDLAHQGVDLTQLTDAQAGALFEDVIARQKLGHSITMRDGGWVGVKTQGLSYILSRFWLKGLGSIGVDIRYLHGRHADVNFGTGTGGRDLFMGRVKAHRNQYGIGANAGLGHVSKSANGLSVGLAAGGNFTAFSGEWAEKVGTMFRFRRVFSGVDSDDIGNAQLGRLARKLLDPTGNPADAWTNPADPNDQDILKQVMHEFDDVSVGWLKSNDTVFKGGLSGSGGAGGKVNSWGPFAGIGIGAEVAKSWTKWREKGGSLYQERDIKASEARINVSGLLSTLAATLKNIDFPPGSPGKNLLNPEIWEGAVKAAFHDGVVGSADVGRTGTSRRHTWIYHDGALTYTPGICSFYQKTHKNAASYVANVAKKLEILAKDKAMVFETPRFFHGGQDAADAKQAGEWKEEKLRMIDQEMVKLSEDLHTALTKALPTQEFREYYEWSPRYLQMINDLESVIRSEKMKPNFDDNKQAKARVKHYQKELDKLKALDDETLRTHGEYRFNIKDNVEFKLKNKGVNLPFVNWNEDLFRATRIDMYH